MGITKQYLKYVPAGNLNLIADSNCNITFVTLEYQEGRFVAVGACEHVYIWDLRQGEKVLVLSGNKARVTYLLSSPNKKQIAVGYADGSIKIFDLKSTENISTFIGHNTEITCLAYDFFGHRLVSGSKDTDIIVWDIIAEIGICRLRGHKDAITKVAFMKNYNIVISSSKDTFVKFWDITNEHNFKTLIGHHSEVWNFVLIKDDQYLITSCNDQELYIWKIYFNDALTSNTILKLVNFRLDENDDNGDMKYPLSCTKIGSIVRVSKGRINTLTVDSTGQVIGCHSNHNVIELFHFLSKDQVKNKKLKGLDKSKRKTTNYENKNEKLLYGSELDTIGDKINRLPIIKVLGKAKGLNIIVGQGQELRVCIVVDNNTIELHSLIITEKNKEPQCLQILKSYGHRTDVRAICFSSDSLAFVTISGDSVKLWNRPTLMCLRTVECGYALSVTFVPGDRHLIVGLKNGNMLIIDIASADLIEKICAHQKELWSIVLLPTLKGIVTGSGDKTIKFWHFQLFEDFKNETKTKILSVIHYKTLKLEEGVLCLKISPNNRFIAVALLDSTVKIFFFDTLKFFVSLYGHKLPVLSMDISDDSMLIATGSADRNIKIWGLDFGDCHKSLFAHNDSVTGIIFIPKTHYLFTCGKDGKIKEWDADSFQKIVTLQGHIEQAYNCAISPNGVYFASCGSDKVVRIYEKSSEILVLEDEIEEGREVQEKNIITTERTSICTEKNEILHTCKNLNNEKSPEVILECLRICKLYKQDCLSIIPPNPLPPLPFLIQMYKCASVEEFLLESIKRIRTSDLHEAILLLPYSAVCEIFQMLINLFKNQYQTEIVAKLTFSLIQIHQTPIVTSQELSHKIEEIKSLVFQQICTLRNILGFNLYGMTFIQHIFEEKEGIQLFKEAIKNKKKKNSKTKSTEKSLKRAIMLL